MNYKSSKIIFLMTVILLIIGCGREKTSENTPIHLNPNMDHQPKYKAQASSNFFEDGAAMRSLIEGTVARGQLREDSAYYFGMNSRGDFIESAPVEYSMERLKRGQERFNIYCSPCHSRIGDGKGIMAKPDYQYVVPPDFHSDSVKQFTDGYIYNVISNGIRNMPSYKHQISVDDRWSIILYLRALQMSHNATIDDIPAAVREEVE